MATNYRRMTCSPEALFDVLANGWLYPSWVVGASRIRGVDADWPKPGTGIHHSVGVWPALLDDATTVLLWDPPRRMRLKARAWPMGEARVEIEVKARRDGCVVRIVEDAVAGPATLVPRFLRDQGLHIRNRETLRRLAYLAEGGAADPQRSESQKD
jgi:hypothetical protein